MSLDGGPLDAAAPPDAAMNEGDSGMMLDAFALDGQTTGDADAGGGMNEVDGGDARAPADAALPPCDPSRFLCEVEEICAGASFACARTRIGEVYCWGDNTYGQLGRGTVELFSTRPAAVYFGAPVRDLSCGVQHACVLLDAALLCWGDNASGQLGVDPATRLEPFESSPYPVSSAEANARELALGWANTCYVRADRSIACWGDNNFGQLGASVPLGERRFSPTSVSAVTDVDELGIGFGYMCMRSGGSLRCWGRNHFGQLGNAMRVDSSSAVDVVDVSSAVALAVGISWASAVLRDGAGVSWGLNEFGYLGSGELSGPESRPVMTMLPQQVIRVRTGGHSCSMAHDGRTWCWGGAGGNARGELGAPTTDVSTPVEVTVAQGIQDIRPGGSYTCALLANGSVTCWGLNDRGQTGNGSSQTTTGVTTVIAP